MTTVRLPDINDYNGWADFIRYQLGPNVIPAIAKEKKPIEDWKNNPLGNWQTEPIPEWLHKEWIAKNKFTDGMAIITGNVWHREDRKGYYLVAGDSDNQIATNEITKDLAKFAQGTLVEQCDDAPHKFHWMFYSIRPILNKEPEQRENDKIPWIEIKCLKRILYCSPGPNKNGSPRRIIGTCEPNTLDTFDKADNFERNINNICVKYGLRYLDKGFDSNRYNKRSNNGSDIELDNKQIESIVELIEPYYKKGVRNFIIFSLSGFLYKIGVSMGSTLELTDSLTHSDRKAATVAEATYDKDSSEVVGYTRLLEILTQFEDTKKAQKIIDEINDIVNEKRQRNKFSHIASLAGKIVAEISHDPLRLVVCDPIAKNVCYATIKEIEVENQKIKVVHFGRTALNTSLVEVSIYQNPLEFLRQPDKYCIKFDSHQRGNFTLEGSIDSILKQLDEMGVVMYQYGAKESLTWMINEFINLDKASISKSVSFEGIVFYDGDLHVSRIDFAKMHPRRTKEECFRCTEYLEKRAKFNVWTYNGRTIDRRDWLASSIKWTLSAPYNFASKQITGQYQRWFSFSGDRDAGKTEMSNEMLEIHGNFLGNNVNSKYSLGAGEFDTSPKLGRALAKTTYPISVSEFGKVEEKGRNGDYAEDLKNAIEKLISRSGKDGSNYDVAFPSCSPVMINGNPKLSASDTVIKRFDNVKFTKEDAHKPTDQRTIEFNEFRNQNRGMLKILGDWSMNYIWDNRQELILSGKYSYRELGDLVIRRFYEFAGVEFPSWLGEWIKDLTLEELEINEKDVIVGIFRELTHKSLSQGRNAGLINPKDEKNGYYETTKMRVIKCLENELWSFIRKGYSGRYLINTSILDLFKDRLPELTLKKLGEIMNIEYKRNTKGMKLICTQAELLEFIDGKIDESDDIT